MENVKVLIIVEISMISADQFYNVNKRMQSIMNSEDPFGGVAVVLLGDILQLPSLGENLYFWSLILNKILLCTIQKKIFGTDLK